MRAYVSRVYVGVSVRVHARVCATVTILKVTFASKCNHLHNDMTCCIHNRKLRGVSCKFVFMVGR